MLAGTHRSDPTEGLFSSFENHILQGASRLLEVAWAAQRSGLHYTAINRHLRPAEVQYVLDDCGAVALVASEQTAPVVASLDLSRVRVRIAAVGAVPGFESYVDVVAAVSGGALEDEREGREMLYSSGTTGRPKGVRKALPGTPFGDPSSAPVVVARGIEAFGGRAGGVYLSRRQRQALQAPPPRALLARPLHPRQLTEKPPATVRSRKALAWAGGPRRPGRAARPWP